jgi:ketol-acid reductoisomerase
MPLKIHRDANLNLLLDKTVAVLGYGSQGGAQAQNLRDSGCRVLVAELPGTDNFNRAMADGFQPLAAAEAVERAELIAVLLPDQRQPDVFREEIRPWLAAGKTLVFAHGFALRYGLLDLPDGVAAVLVAPLGPGTLVRSKYLSGGGVPCLLAAAEPTPPWAKELGLAYAKGIGATRAGVVETTIAEETETDLFAEQAVLCGGLAELVQAAFDTLVEAGYRPEIAYQCCVHEARQILDMICQGGLEHMRRNISATACYGALTRGRRIISTETRDQMQRMLAEIRDGSFASEWMLRSRDADVLEAMRLQATDERIEQAGQQARELFSGNPTRDVFPPL